MDRLVPTEMRKWMALTGEVLVMLTLGSAYSFGNLSPYFTSYMRHALNDTSITYATSTWVNTFSGIGHSASMPLAGYLEKLVGVRLAIIIGCAVFSGGVFLSAFTMNWSFYAFASSYGLMFGIGTGLSYPLCIACSIRWFPDKKGLITGVTLLGFGLSSFIFNIVQTSIINPNNLQPNSFDPNDISDQKFFSQPEVLDRVPTCFMILGATYAGLQLIGSMLISSPSENTGVSDLEQLVNDSITVDVDVSRLATITNRAINDDADDRGQPSTDRSVANSISGPENNSSSDPDIGPREVLRTKHFYMLYFIFSCNFIAGNFINTQYKAFGQTFISDDFYLTLVGSLASICNASGRLFWGFVADRTSNKFALFTICCLGGALLYSLIACVALPRVFYSIWVCLIFLSFSGQPVVCPATMAKMYGIKHFATNYGLLYSTGVIAAIATATLVSLLLHLIDWYGLFYICGTLYVFAATAAFLFRAKTPSGEEV